MIHLSKLLHTDRDLKLDLEAALLPSQGSGVRGVKLSLLSSIILLAAGSASAGASDAEIGKLDKVKVTADAEAAEGYVVKSTATATKTDTLLRDIPQSITVVTDEQIRDQGVQGLADAVRFVPGVNMAQGEGNRDTAVMRGNSSTGDFFLDGIRDDVQYIRDLYNLERVEVLKGSNAMIFGRGGSGGVINRVSKQAEWERVREVSVTAGSWQNRRLSADVGDGLSSDVAARVTAVYEDSDSYRDGFNLKRYGINPTGAFKLGDHTLATVGYEYFKDERVADRGVPSWLGKPLDVDPSRFFGDPSVSPISAEAKIFSALIEHEFSDQVQLRNRTRIAGYDKFYQNVFSGAINTKAANGFAPGTLVAISAYNNATQRDNLFNQTDLVVKFDTGGIKQTLLAGVELGQQDTDNFRQTGYFTNPANNNGAQVTSVQVPLVNPFATPAEFRQSATDANNTSEAKILAVYLQDQVELAPAFQVVAGVRYDHLVTDVTDKRNGGRFESSDDLVSPRVGLIYKPVEAVSVYTSYSLAYVPRAGDQLASLTLTNQALDPEKFKSLELGAKWDLSKNLSATAAMYKLTRSNVAVVSPLNPNELILPVGDSQRAKGLELSLTGKITNAWSLTAGYSHQDAEILRDIKTSATSTTLAGSTLANVPKDTLSLWNRYDLGSRWGIGLGVIKRSEMFASVDNAVTVPGYTRVDAAVYYQLNQHLRLQANIENLTDERYFVSANSNNNITPGSPLAVRVNMTASF